MLLDARITYTITDDNRISAIQKGLGSYFTLDEIKKSLDLAISVSQNIRKILKEAISKFTTS